MVEVECQDRVSNTRSRLLLIGLLVGVAAGTLAALFLAPKPGREIRDRIVRQPKEMVQRVQCQVNNVRENVKLTWANMQRRAEEEAAKVEAPK